MVKHRTNPRRTALERDRFSPAYSQRLSQGLSHFLRWVAPERYEVVRHPRRRAQLDHVLAEYVQWCHDTGTAFWIPKHAVLALQHKRHGKRVFSRAWTCLWAWRHKLPASHRIPITPIILQAMFAVAINLWLSGVNGLMLPFAILLRLGFYGLLRPGEACRLRVRDVVVQSTVQGQAQAVLALEHPKNRKTMGLQQFTVVRDEPTAHWTAWLLEGLKPGHKLWPSSSNRFRKCFVEVLEVLGLPSGVLGPASLRAGGATHSYLNNVEISRLQFQDRKSVV